MTAVRILIVQPAADPTVRVGDATFDRRVLASAFGPGPAVPGPGEHRLVGGDTPENRLALHRRMLADNEAVRTQFLTAVGRVQPEVLFVAAPGRQTEELTGV